MAAIFTLCLETGVECTYPVPEGTTAGLQLLCAQVFGVIFITVMEATRRFTIDVRRATYAVSNTILLGALVISFILIMFFKGDSKRPHAEPSSSSSRHTRKRQGSPTHLIIPQTY
jgi:membrane protein CcdC involved in cytochrome C biogenesis